MTDLGLPSIPARRGLAMGDGLAFATHGHHFTVEPGADIPELARKATAPLSVIVQVTKRCDFDCSFCSEILQMPDPSLDRLEAMRNSLKGTKRIFLSGGEPLMRRDFGDIVDMFADENFVLAVPTNATHGLQHAKRIAGKIAFANIGLEGPRGITNRVRGDYDKVMPGVRALQAEGIPISLSAVVYRSTLAALPFTCQIADVLDAGKVKLIMPLRKGNALNLAEHEFITDDEAAEAFTRLSELRSTYQWSPALRLTTWTPDNEGHMIVVEPNGKTNAWPVYDSKDLFEPLGNVLEEPIEEIWKRYRFKENHFRKYLGASIRTAAHSGGSSAA
ncbi:radical SAM/SPASM domain-containing protein [Streptomyces cinnamoneus]|uniref:radical SAM/SPASM domain-containing protein n=1 Tax=Streptomyces cinnamoneus TaxID=53446 RepID=UPI000CEE94AD|nr:radical SAM protein [Streptomyces cinnamoneus]PPT14780.1 radical SAM protein [Streptomyces cinnamoneus]